jgi:FMN phosphatase YigB (HAD superfamily)
MTPHAAWLIDLDGTLYRSLPVKLAMGVELCFAGGFDRQVVRAFRHEHESLRVSDSSDCDDPFAEQLARTAKRLNCPMEQVRSIIDDWMFARPGRWLRRFRRASLLAEITQFKAAGGRTALVSDYPARVKLRALEATNLFDIVIANGETDEPYRLKPAPDAFLLAAQQFNVAASECLVLGDRSDADGLAAQRAGMAFRRIPGKRILSDLPSCPSLTSASNS